MNKRIARLYAVQILYQMDYVRSDLKLAVETFLKYYERSELPQADREHLRKLVNGIFHEKEELRRQLDQVVTRRWARIEQLLRIILEVGCYEILFCPETSAKILISEYVTIAAGFFSSAEPDFVNGVLEKIAIKARPAEEASFVKKEQANVELLQVKEPKEQAAEAVGEELLPAEQPAGKDESKENN